MLTEYPRQPVWNGADLSVFEYIPWSDPHRNSVTDLILDFKKPLTYAMKIVEAATITTVEENERTLHDVLKCRYIVSAPSHRAGKPAPTSPCEILCAALARRYSWLTHLPGALERAYTVEKSATASSLNERPTEVTHLASILYSGSTLPVPPPPYTIILVDDIFTLGHTSRACRKILQRDTDCSAVVGLFVGRTRRRSA